MSDSGAILVVGPAWIGDMVMAQSLFKTLAREYPGAAVDVLAPDWSMPLLERMPEVRAGVRMPLGHGSFGLLERYRIGRDLRGRGYERAVVLPRSLKAALVPFFARIPQRTGYRGEMRYGLINDRRPLDRGLLRRTVDRYVALGLPADAPLPPEAIPQPSLRVDAENQQRQILELGLETAEPVVGLMPGAEYGEAKRWPHFAELTRELVADGYRVWVFGSHSDRHLGDIIAEAGGDRVSNLCGRTRLQDAIDLIAATDAVVTNDSGLMHVAAALDRPMVALYGSSDPGYTPPLTPRAAVLSLGLDCSPCFERKCRFGHVQCLVGIEPPAVRERLAAVMEVER